MKIKDLIEKLETYNKLQVLLYRLTSFVSAVERQKDDVPADSRCANSTMQAYTFWSTVKIINCDCELFNYLKPSLLEYLKKEIANLSSKIENIEVLVENAGIESEK